MYAAFLTLLARKLIVFVAKSMKPEEIFEEEAEEEKENAKKKERKSRVKRSLNKYSYMINKR
jgi:hypothetical protein